MASNPFLMDATPSVDAANPFLMDEPVVVSNPFLCDDSASTLNKPLNNPFADDIATNVNNNVFETPEVFPQKAEVQQEEVQETEAQVLEQKVQQDQGEVQEAQVEAVQKQVEQQAQKDEVQEEVVAEEPQMQQVQVDPDVEEVQIIEKAVDKKEEEAEDELPSTPESSNKTLKKSFDDDELPPPPPPEEPVEDLAEEKEQKEMPKEEEQKDMPKESASMSTGEALFSELPAANLSSTGVHLFGLNEEQSGQTTGADLFGVKAPAECARPALGEMSGWDEDFDAKFDTAASDSAGGGFGDSIVTVPGKDPFDPFCGSSSGAALFTSPPAFSSVGETDKSFGQDDFDPQALKQNPFLDKETKQALNIVEEEELFDSDTSKPLLPLPRCSMDEMLRAEDEGWKCYVRYPAKKKLGQSRYWKKVLLKLVTNLDKSVVIQIFEPDKDTSTTKPLQEVPIQVAYSMSEIGHQVFDQYSKLFTLKLQYVTYKERAGIRPGQLTKMQRLTGKFGFLAKAVEDADYEGVKEFASDMKKLGMPLEHAPVVSELLKIGSDSYEDLRQLTLCFEQKLFLMDALRDRALTYKAEEVQLTAVEEIYVEQTKSGHVHTHLCRVRVFFLSFLSGMPTVELGVNDEERMGLEVVGRHDILPVPTEQWIRYEDVQLHPVVDKNAFEESHIIRFVPPDSCYLELLRFRTRPPRTKELALQARCTFQMTGNCVEIRSDLLVPFIPTKAWGQVYCDDVAVRIPLPECWIYQFRTEKHHMSLSQLAAGNINLGTRMGSVKSAHRRAGKVKGIERLIGAIDSSQSNSELMETSSGTAKYEHQHRAIVWRIPRLPKHGQGSYTSHEFVCRLQLTSFDELPAEFDRHFFVEFTQPATPTSNTVLRSVSIADSESEEPAEKFVKYLARHEYKLEIEFKEKEQSSYVQASKEVKVEQANKDDDDEEFPDAKFEKNDSDSDSD